MHVEPLKGKSAQGMGLVMKLACAGTSGPWDSSLISGVYFK